MTAWVTGAAILVQAGVPSPSSDDTTWSAACAAAVNAAIDHRLAGATVTGSEPELVWSALGAGVEAYKRREAAFGLTGFVDLQGAAIRVARDYLEAQSPIIARYATRGIA